MVHVKPFVLDHWDTCVDPLSLQDLTKLGALNSSVHPIEASNSLIYGSVLGKPELRQRILALYGDAGANPAESLSLTVTQGAISANFLVLDTLLGPGDHVICQYPTYQQLYDVPRRAGAEVSLWRTHAEHGWVPDVSELQFLVKKNTKMIIINNPNNPTGASIPRGVLEKLVAFASERGIIIFSDEVFRPLFHDNAQDLPHSIISFAGQYKNIIAVSSLSKAFSLPGIRVGWIISPNSDLVNEAINARDYTTISVSQIDQDIATYALDPVVREKILDRSRSICRQNLASLENFIAQHSTQLSWVKPTGASSAFVRILDRQTGVPVDDASYCENVLRDTGLLIVPGGKSFGTEAAEDLKGYLRVGFVCSTGQFERALSLWDEYLSVNSPGGEELA
ncbi:aspartate aminotransferase [Penicillium waksmanii]|uniref:aspartate aminotransferase n=1 Tax=Penicillium waksmanii TaxID=69791 RepID=UPI0025496312|nr:aspartate aminotransferase [Penicillium waksmanii]KAJ5984264.1 aspartate aminotransferase [Penicillium waksmanii]